MKYRELEYARTSNLGNYESEKITLKVELNETEDIDESFRTLKATVFRLQSKGEILDDSKRAVEADKRLESVKKAFPDDLTNLLTFQEIKDAVIIKPKHFLGSGDFAKIGSIIRGLNGQWVSRGKDSHFIIKR